MRRELGWFGVLVALAGVPAPASIDALHARSAGSDEARLRADAAELIRLAEAEIVRAGIEAATAAFRAAPWRRDPNAMHLRGVTQDGISWFDSGQPELIGLDISGMRDVEGQRFTELARISATDPAHADFRLLFPHPVTGRAAVIWYSCLLLPDGARILCAGGFVDD